MNSPNFRIALVACDDAANEMRRSAAAVRELYRGEDDARIVAGNEEIAATLTNAAYLMREMAADFERHAGHAGSCAKWRGDSCSCSLDAARARWRLR